MLSCLGNTVYLASVHFDEENTAVAGKIYFEWFSKKNIRLEDAEGYAWVGLRGPTKDNMTWSGNGMKNHNSSIKQKNAQMKIKHLFV